LRLPGERRARAGPLVPEDLSKRQDLSKQEKGGRPPAATFSRRRLLGAGVAGGVAGALFDAPAFRTPGSRPMISHGVQSGDATAGTALVWSRADRPGRLWVQAGSRPDLRGADWLRGPVLTPKTGLTGRLRLRDLPASGDRRLHPVLGVRVGPGPRRRVRPEQ